MFTNNYTNMHLTPEQAYRRAGGRRRYNAQRGLARAARRALVAQMLRDDPGLCQADIARRLGVNRSTVCRDMAALNALWRDSKHQVFFIKEYLKW